MQAECAKIQGEVMACADAAGCNYEKNRLEAQKFIECLRR